MTSPEHDEEAIFKIARRTPAGPARASALEALCNGNPALRERVEALLRAADRADSFLAPPAVLVETVAQTTEQPETVIGPYRLTERLDEGGMGVVYVAEQQHPVRRKVALKVIKPGMDTRQVVARFEAERQALALMDHPNIAKVFDGGATDSGRPFFVMELVRGVSITRFCDDNRLGPRERLKLFADLCSAVQHAHQKGIVHRDLKPSNVLVTSHDGEPVAKVIDFGVAKALGQSLTDKTVYTGAAQMIGTPLYMSPEQAGGGGPDVDTRADVYALGVLLYELLTGTTPFERDRLQNVGYDEIRRIIREEEPPKPSNRISTLGRAARTVSAARGTDPRKLSALVRGELDWIVMKALEKDRDRRYETASAFAADVQRYLDDEPVLACPPSAAYRLRKFVRRNKVTLATGALIALVMLAAAGSIGWVLNERRERERRELSERQERQRREADEIQRSVDEGRKLLALRRWPEALVLAQHACSIMDRTEGHDALRTGVEELCNDLEALRLLEDIDLRRADVTRDHGPAFTRLGFVKPAAEYYPVFRKYGIDVLALNADAAAEEIRKRQISDSLVEALDDWAQMEPDPPTRERLLAVARKANPEGILAQWRAALGRGDLAEMRKILTRLEVTRTPPATLAYLGRSASYNGLRKEGLELLLAAHGQHPNDFWINFDLAYSHTLTAPSQLHDALRYYTGALALRPRSHAVYFNIGWVLYRQDNRAAALAAWNKAVELKPDYAFAHCNIGVALLKDGKVAEGEAALVKAVRLQPDIASAHNSLARLYAETNRTKEAFASFDRALALNPQMPQAYSGRGVLRVREKEYDEAVADFHLALSHDKTFVEAYQGLGSVAEKKGQYADAVKWYETALRYDRQAAVAHYRLGITYRAWGRQEARNGSPKLATEYFDKAIAKFNDVIRLDESDAEAWYSLGNASRDRGQIRAAVTAFEKAAALKSASNDPEYQPHYNLGNVFHRLGDYPKAIEAFRASIKANPDYVRAYTNLCAALGEVSDSAELEKVAASALARDKNNPDSIRGVAAALDRQGRYADALSFLKQSLEKFEGGEEGKARLKELIGLYEHFARLQKQLPAILSGKEVPVAADLLHLGEVCLATKNYTAAVRFYREAFAKQPDAAASLDDGYRFDAARAAACAGSGLDKGGALTPEEQAQWRKQTLDWLRADLKLWSRNVEKGGPLPEPAVLRGLQRWRHHAHLAGVRGDAIDKLPPDERDDWRELWADVDALLKKIPVP